MDSVRIVEIKEDIRSRNNEQAKDIREELKRKKIFFLNVMSSPGSGKTTLLLNLINRLKRDYAIGVIEADIDSAVDAQTIAAQTGVKTIQIHTSGACHITCQMAHESLAALGVDGLDVVILENIGNLVCPAEFDTGATKNLVLLSVPECDDKPLKYPLMFEVASAVAVTKKDVSPAFDFSIERATSNVHMRNPDIPIFFVSGLENDGIDALEIYLRAEIEKVKHGEYLESNALCQKEYFNRIAPTWRGGDKIDKKKVKTFLSDIPLKKGERVLDIACGSGVLDEYLLSLGLEVDGIDISENMIARAKSNKANARAHYSVADFYTYSAAPYDCLIAFDCYPHFVDKRMFERQAYNLLKEGGTLWIVFDQSRATINSRHSDCSDKISVKLESAEKEATVFADGFDVIFSHDGDEKYVLGLKKSGKKF